ncbi:MAG TPA: MarR family transcriptional regulator [Jiangellaceae bacterium]|jgi:DNA-binding MarR family transcriptional regulator|nr:MarR family transcriptional regulator [Jiangellaceae bacterium]
MPTQPRTDQRITPEQLEVWRMFLRVHARLIRRLEEDLQSKHNLPLAWYDVLVRLVEANNHRLRMSELADRVMLSPSGLTRLVDRLVGEGLVRREHAEQDGRGFYAVLTNEGYERLRESSGTHLRGIRDYVMSRYTDDELRAVAAYLSRLDI